MSINAAAARVIARHARNGTEALELLDMLGLLTEDGRIAPDNLSRPVVLVDVAAGKGQVVSDSITRRPTNSTAPEGLRELPPVTVAETKPRPTVFSKPESKRKPRPKRTGPKNPTTDTGACGSNKGYARHQAAWENACDPCREAHAEHGRQHPSERRKTQKPRKVAVERTDRCGSKQGYDDHFKAPRTQPCEPCTDAMAADSRRRYALRAAAKGLTYTPMPERRKRKGHAECGELGGRSVHRRRGEEVCPACREAVNAHARNKKRERKQAA